MVATVASEQEAPGFEPAGCVCMFCLYLPGHLAPLSSHCPETLNPECVSKWLSASVWRPCDRLVTCPGCTQSLAQCQLGLAPAPLPANRWMGVTLLFREEYLLRSSGFVGTCSGGFVKVRVFSHH